MTFAKAERAALCDLFDQVGPDAPTLCEGWLTHDLAAHLWLRETDPVAAGGVVAKPLAGLLERRRAETKTRWPYAELVDKVRNGPARFSVFAIPGVDEGANTTEFFVHHEDVRRGGDTPDAPRDLGPEGIRVNLVAAGPVRTIAARSIPGFEQFEDAWDARAPLGWDVKDASPVAAACVALFSDLFPATTGDAIRIR